MINAQVGQWKNYLEDDTVSVFGKMDYADSLILHYRKSAPDSAIVFAHVLFDLAVSQKDTFSVDYATVQLGSLHRILGDYDSSVYYYNIALTSYKEQEFEEGIASIYNNLATVYKLQGRYDLAIRNYHDALEVFRKSDNYNACANLYSSFAGLYLRLENYEKAKQYWEIAATYYEKDHETMEITHVFRGLARIKLHEKKYDEAEEYLKRAVELDSINQVSVLLAEDYLLFLDLFNRTHSFNEFEKYKNPTRELMLETANPQNAAMYYEQCGDYDRMRGWDKEALANFDSCLTYTSGDDISEWKMRVMRKKLRLMIVLDYPAKVMLEVFDEIQSLETEVAAIHRDRITQESDAEYELKEKEDKISLLNEKNKTAEQLIQKERELNEKSQQLVIFLTIGMILFVAILGYILFINRKLGITKKELEHNVEQKEFLFRELNHRVKNNLHIVNSFLGIEMNGRSEEVKEILKICETRIHSLGLMHEMLYQGEMKEEVDLKDYLEKLTKFVSESLAKENTKIQVSSPPGILLTTQKIVLIGLIVNELLTNAIKYARIPGKELALSVNVRQKGGFLSISVRDNGVGLKEDFDPQRPNTLGMKMAYGLTRQLGGTFSYQNASPGSEFLVSIELT